MDIEDYVDFCTCGISKVNDFLKRKTLMEVKDILNNFYFDHMAIQISGGICNFLCQG